MVEATPISENLVHEWKHVRNTTEQSFIEDPYEFSNANFIFFWWDAHENQYDGNGTVHFFGRSYDPVDKSFKSCCLTLNMQRNIFLLPRTNFKLDPARSVTLKDVHDEFNDRIAAQLGLPSFSSRNVSKTHCFDVNVPRRAEYLQIRYSAEYPAIKYTAGNTFSRVFGANQSFLEMFLLERNIKGPCWLEVKNATKDTKALTRCHFNIKCANVADVSVVKIDREPPPLVAFVLRVRTVEDTVAMRHKIVMLAWVVQEKYRISDVGAFNRHMFTFTGPQGGLFSNQLYEEMEKCNVAGREFDDERQLLNHFLQQIGKIDPDLIIGHDLLGHDLDALHSRIQDLKITEHANLGRFRVNRLPKSSTCHRQMFIGRMLCDLKLSAEELIKCKTYDLDSMVQQVLETKRRKIEQSCSDWKEALKSGTFQLLDAAYILRLTQKLGVVAVALSLTNVCGNTMARTLLGGRSERNEFLLLHAFHEQGHIVPNRSKKGKPWRGRSNKSITGGLVLPPRVGLYGSYVLLMDFMSLYPSIIREYNVCPSTFALTKNFKIVLPARGAPLGVLPQIVTNLIEKRCTTKNETYKMALKMTANSMFGYLGYPSSRFYSKYLAVYIITKGREILTNAVATIKEMKHNVIYGDTDSVMVQIDSSNYSDVIET